MSSNSDDPILSKVFTCFDHALKSKLVNPKNKITDDAVGLISEVAKVLVIEAVGRAAQQANLENKKKINLDHVEIILPQLMLDFP
ncbi:hypothetical protein NQ315_009392 [Exocentrus adspersus]|uniref:Centromere protein X n=1 Tax=Exocentrus adspersus TaxID=1586481 RepID=A0AAV8WH54_9CUCU|nr:hypothetical protein NQ315_009392 [Exocentrus adspersus]